MPSTKKRVNLTIPDAVYDQLQAYKSRSGITNDASACLQLIVQQLSSLEKMESLMRLAQSLSLEQLAQLSREGLSLVKDQVDRRGD